MARTDCYSNFNSSYTVWGQSREKNKKEKKLKSAMLASQLKLITNGNNSYSGQPIKGRKETVCPYCKKPAHWKRGYRKRLWGMQELQEQENQESSESQRMTVS